MLSSHRLTPSLSADLIYQFPRRPQHLFLIKKTGSSHVDSKASELARYLQSQHRLTVYIETDVHSTQASLFPDCLAYDARQHRHIIEVVVTLGGDGTALHFNSLFNDSHTIPVLLSFSMGTLGFLTPFDFKDYQLILSQLLKAIKRHKPQHRNDEQQQPKLSDGPAPDSEAEAEASSSEDEHEADRQGADGQANGADAAEDEEFVISLCPRMRLLAQVWKKPKARHVQLTEEQRLSKEEERRRRRRLSHGISDEDDETSSEDDDGEAEQREENEEEEATRQSVQGQEARESNERDMQRVASIEARQCKIDRQRAAEQRIVQRAESSTSSSSFSSPSPPTQQSDSEPSTRSRSHSEVYLAATFHPLNEVLLSGHTTRSLTSIDISLIQEDGKHCLVSTVLADALIISTATGSTAYSMSAGGPMVSPNTHCLIITPVCPHTLSFRPLVLPDSTHLLLAISEDSRARVGQIICDGVGGRRVRKGEWVTVRQDSVPVWSVNYVSRQRNQGEVRRERKEQERRGDEGVEDAGEQRVDSSVLWLRSLSKKLGWNTREGTNRRMTQEMKDNAVDQPSGSSSGSKQQQR